MAYWCITPDEEFGDESSFKRHPAEGDTPNP
jgi:hypothetical protein